MVTNYKRLQNKYTSMSKIDQTYLAIILAISVSVATIDCFSNRAMQHVIFNIRRSTVAGVVGYFLSTQQPDHRLSLRSISAIFH